MKIKKLLTFNNIKTIFTIILFIGAALFTSNFYKTTIGLIANKYEEAMTLNTIVFAYLVPVIAFILYFANYYVKQVEKNKKTKVLANNK